MRARNGNAPKAGRPRGAGKRQLNPNTAMLGASSASHCYELLKSGFRDCAMDPIAYEQAARRAARRAGL